MFNTYSEMIAAGFACVIGFVVIGWLWTSIVAELLKPLPS